MITDEKDIWEKRLNNIFRKKEKSETEIFLSVVSMILYNNIKNEDVSRLYSCTDLDTFLKVITLFECRTITFPSKKEIRESIELALVYYYKNVMGVDSYDELKKLNIMDENSFSSISIGKRLSKLSKEIVRKLDNMQELFDREETK